MWQIRPHVGIDNQRPALCMQTQTLYINPLETRLPARGQKHSVSNDFPRPFNVFNLNLQLPTLLANSSDSRLRQNLQATPFEKRCQAFRNFFVNVREKVWEHLHNRHFDPESLVDRSKFEADDPAANDNQPGGDLRL